MSKLNSKLFKSKMSENGLTSSEGGEGSGTSGFKMGNVVQQCVEVHISFFCTVIIKCFIASKILTRDRLSRRGKMELIS